MDPHTLALQGDKFSPEKVQKLESYLIANPNDLTVRTQLLGYYCFRSLEADTMRQFRDRHILWIIGHHPKSEIAGSSYCDLHDNTDSYQLAKELWLKQVKVYGHSAKVVGNAGSFLILLDREMARMLLKRAQALEPDNAQWPMRLGLSYRLDMIDILDSDLHSQEKRKVSVRAALIYYERAYHISKDRERKLYCLLFLARTALAGMEDEQAFSYATTLAKKAAQVKHFEGYGDAIHWSNLVLGSLALQSGNMKKAQAYLLAAGNVPGSPTLIVSGPDMSLAQELLKRGERDTVLDYLKLCAKFWKYGEQKLERWTSEIQKGFTPDFHSNSEN